MLLLQGLHSDRATKPRPNKWWPFIMATLIAFASTAAIGAEARQLRIIYPILAEPYASVFAAIVRGIEETARLPSTRIALSSTPDIDSLKRSIDAQDLVVALGGRSLQAAEQLSLKTRPIVGAVVVGPKQSNGSDIGVSLTPDPSLLIEKLRFFAPHIKEILVVYRPESHAYLMELATLASDKHGIQLTALPAADLQAAAKHFRGLLENGVPGTSALWLLRDSGLIDEKAIVPFILEEAWKKNLVVFSSNPNHVSRGALFSLFPDNRGLGRQLGALVNDLLDGKQPNPAMQPLRSVRTAVNLRTAEHLGLAIDPSDREAIQLTFPAR